MVIIITEKILGTSKISAKYQVSLLEAVRKELNITDMDRLVVWIKKDNEIVIRKA